ncbi:hypothetical protein QCE47_02745 [Caballeronia sp. LZ025]|uniref:hypothetical protein n=1 Tax=Caballeronia TaxID=1827195 RepID=UPI001FD05F27|nr:MULTISPECIES: hypothetical protein [Caballeronia]MDR5731268.1 hypothetical protein [Caballeronia sp. LZ025]
MAKHFGISVARGSIILTIGSRTVHLCRDYVERKRIPELFEFHAGEEQGHWEVLVLRTWLIEFSGQPGAEEQGGTVANRRPLMAH